MRMLLIVDGIEGIAFPTISTTKGIKGPYTSTSITNLIKRFKLNRESSQIRKSSKISSLEEGSLAQLKIWNLDK